MFSKSLIVSIHLWFVFVGRGNWLILLLVGVRWCLLKGLLVLLVRELGGWYLPVQLVFLVAFDVKEEQQELWVA